MHCPTNDVVVVDDVEWIPRISRVHVVDDVSVHFHSMKNVNANAIVDVSMIDVENDVPNPNRIRLDPTDDDDVEID